MLNLEDLTPDQVRRYFEARVPDFPARATGEITVRCPFHDDSSPSMSINTEVGVWFCHAENKGGNLVDFEKTISGCDGGEAHVNIAQLVGVKDGGGNTADAKVEAIYDYKDEQGRLRFQVLRKRKPDGNKTFTQRRPAPTGKGWIYDKEATSDVLYRLPEVITASEVIIVEGEKCVERLLNEMIGLDHAHPAVTCNPGGAGRWREEYSPYFAGKKVVILPDNDHVGRSHSNKVAASVHRFACGVKLVELPGLPIKGDVVDYFDQGGTVGELLACVRSGALWQPMGEAPPQVGVLMSEVQKEELAWLWKGKVPLGKLTILEGDPGLGKSTISLDLAALVTRGFPMPDGQVCPEGGVVVICVEDGLGDTVRPRLEAAGADLSRVVALNEVPDSDGPRLVCLPEDTDHLEQAIARVNAKLVIIDPLVAVMSSKLDSHKDQHVRRLTTQLAHLAEKTKAAFLALRHLNRAEGKNAINRGGGSVGIGASARSVLLVAKDPADDSRCVIASVKNNLAIAQKAVSYRVDTAENGYGRIRWLGEVQYTADQLVCADAGGTQAPAESKLDAAKNFLCELLEAGPRRKEEVAELAEEEGISLRTLRRAAEELAVISKPTEFQGPHYWRLPDEPRTAEHNVSVSTADPCSCDGLENGDTGVAVHA